MAAAEKVDITRTLMIRVSSPNVVLSGHVNKSLWVQADSLRVWEFLKTCGPRCNPKIILGPLGTRQGPTDVETPQLLGVRSLGARGTREQGACFHVHETIAVV